MPATCKDCGEPVDVDFSLNDDEIVAKVTPCENCMNYAKEEGRREHAEGN